jgi:hypothetical protein
MDSINISTNKTNRHIPIKPNKPATKAEVPVSDTGVDATGMTDVSALVEKLMKMDDVRKEKVERGLEILNNPNYPTDDILDAVAERMLSEDL